MTRKTRFKLLKLILLLALTVLIPFTAAGIVYGTAGNAYEDTYYAELPRKLERLRSVPGRRIVVIGGSSVAFGIDSKLVERETGIPCVNFGLYAAFGLKPMLDLSLGCLNESDIVIVAPEINSQMYSTYCGYDYLLQAFETEPMTLLGLGKDYYAGLVSKLPGYLRGAANLRRQGGAPDAGVYALSSFDGYGDIVYPRKENVMDLGYSEENLPEIDASVVTSAFTGLINDYTRSAWRKGADVYFAFCPVNALSVKDVDEDMRDAFVRKLEEELICPILSPLGDNVMDAGFFYDSNFHLNDTGVLYHSLMLASDVQRILGAMHETAEALPHPPVLNRDNAVLSSGVQDGFAYDVTARGTIVTELDESLKALTVLEIPQSLGGADVITVSADLFDGCRAENIILPSSITKLPGRLFAGTDKLKTVDLYAGDLPEVGNELLDGARAGLMIRVPPQIYVAYVTDYFWGIYSSQLGEIK